MAFPGSSLLAASQLSLLPRLALVGVSGRETEVTSFSPTETRRYTVHAHYPDQRTSSATMLTNVLCTCVKRARQFSLATLSHEQISHEVSHEWEDRKLLRRRLVQNQEELLSCRSEISTTLAESLSRNVCGCLWFGWQTVSRSSRLWDRQMCASWKSHNTLLFSSFFFAFFQK